MIVGLLLAALVLLTLVMGVLEYSLYNKLLREEALTRLLAEQVAILSRLNVNKDVIIDELQIAALVCRKGRFIHWYGDPIDREYEGPPMK